VPEAPLPADPWAKEIEEFQRFLGAHTAEQARLAANLTTQLRSARVAEAEELQRQVELLEADVEHSVREQVANLARIWARRPIRRQPKDLYRHTSSPKPKVPRESNEGLERPPRSFRPPVATLFALRTLFSEREYRLRIEPIASDGQVLVAGMWSRGDALWRIRSRQGWTWMQLVAAAARLALIEGLVRLNRSKGELG
jgi:hypothetical protein